jgi:uncharacterized protein YjbJ (UPF0337 family)
MHKDEAKGVANQAKGSIKEAAGRATGNERLEAEGVADKAKGNVQEGVGKLKEGARKILKN